jgi:hypothetical protein
MLKKKPRNGGRTPFYRKTNNRTGVTIHEMLCPLTSAPSRSNSSMTLKLSFKIAIPIFVASPPEQRLGSVP